MMRIRDGKKSDSGSGIQDGKNWDPGSGIWDLGWKNFGSGIQDLGQTSRISKTGNLIAKFARN